MKEEEKKGKEALSAWHARRKAVTDEMFALLDVVGRLTPAQQARKSEPKPPSLPKRRKRKKKRRRRTRRTPEEYWYWLWFDSGYLFIRQSCSCVSWTLFL